MAKRLFNVPIALVSLIDDDRYWFKSRSEISENGSPKELSISSNSIFEEDLLQIFDAAASPQFLDNPMVTGEPYIRFYAGQPLMAANGLRLGRICIMDTKPRRLDSGELGLLRDLAALVEREIHTVDLATTDELTKIANRRGFEIQAQNALDFCKRVERPATMAFLDLNDFKMINDRFGHQEGDHVLATFSSILINTLRRSDVIGRLGGDEFVVLLTNTTPNEAEILMSRFQSSIEAYNKESGKSYELSYSVGQVAYDPEGHLTIDDLISESDRAMYVDKRLKKSLI